MIDQLEIQKLVRTTLVEDIGPGDLTAELVNPEFRTEAHLISRQNAILCGVDWFDEVYRQLDTEVSIRWHASDGDEILRDQVVCHIYGRARPILTGERSALNLLQTLSGTATATRHYVRLVAGTTSKILDTRKTIPGLRAAQKYAVRCGGGTNHRMGLYDGILIKENHLRSGESLGDLWERVSTKKPPAKLLEVEVESLVELNEALDAGAKRILLDNFTIAELKQAVKTARGRAELEASGNVSTSTVRAIAETGVDYISVGALTKHLGAVDFSLEFRI